jgi:hypothetical protein
MNTALFAVSLFGVLVLFFLYRIIKFRGFRGAIFGAAIDRTLGELDLGRRGLLRTRLRVVRLDVDDPDSPPIGLEVVSTTFLGYHIHPVVLSVAHATNLQNLLARAVVGN